MYASCVLLGIAGVLSHQDTFTYTKPWDSRRSNIPCEMCFNESCLSTNDARCDYYAGASKIVDDDKYDDNDKPRDDKVDEMFFELIDTATLSSNFKVCVPFVSQYTDCTKENTCIGCKFCSCNEDGVWTCREKQQCRPGPKLNIDHHTLDIVLDSLKRKGNKQKKRNKRSAFINNINCETRNVTFKDILPRPYGAKPLTLEDNVSNIINDIDDIETFSNGLNKTEINSDTVSYPAINEKEFLSSTTDVTTSKNENIVDLLEFNDILKSWSDLNTDKPMKFIEEFQYYNQHDYKESNNNDVASFDPVRLVKRDTTNKNEAKIEMNSTDINGTYAQILIDALYGLNKITSEKQTELQELINIRDNVMKIAKAHNITVNTNITYSHVNYTKHHIAIYKLDVFDNCLKKIKDELIIAIEDILKTQLLRNLTSSPREFKVLLNTIKKHILPQKDATHINLDTVSPHEYKQKTGRHMEYNRERVMFQSLINLSNILTLINNTTTDTKTNPLSILNLGVKKILTRAIKQLYNEDIAVVELTIQETFHDIDLDDIGIKWNRMMQAIDHSGSSDKLHRMKLLHMALNTDIGKMEDMISLLELAHHRRLTVANGSTMDKFLSRIKHNLTFIDNKVHKIIELRKSKMLRQPEIKQRAAVKKMSLMQKLKKIFKNSKDDIKDMLRKKFPKSEIIKRIAKKKVDELEKQRMLQYQETMKKWQEKLNIIPKERKKRSLGFQVFVDRIKSIIPKYLRGKVKKGLDSKKSNKTRSSKSKDRKKKHNRRTTTVKTTTFSRPTS